MTPEQYEAQRRIINSERAQALERKAAFNAVIRYESDLSEARKKLSFARDNDRPVRELERWVADLEAQLADAVAYCREANPERLAQHDADKASAAEKARKTQKAQEAERAAGEKQAAARSAAMAEQRRDAKIKR